MPRALSLVSIAAAALIASFLAGCGGSAASGGTCGAHQYSYVGGGFGISGGAAWYGGDYGGGWYDPGDDGSDYANENANANGSTGSGSGDDGSGDDGSYSNGDDNSGDNSSDDGSGDDGSDDSSGDDGTASKKELHTADAKLHIAGVTAATHDACYAYSCDLICAVGSPATQEREALGYSATSMNDACETAAHGIETWAHDSLGANVSACKQAASGDSNASTPENTARTPAAPTVSQGFSSSTPSTRAIASARAPR